MSFFLSTTHKCARLLFCRAVCSLSPLFTVVDASCCGRAADGMQSLVRRRVLWLLTNCFCVLIDIVHAGIGCKVTHCDMRLQGVCPHGKLAQRIDSQRHASILQEGKFRRRGRTTNTAIATSTNSAKFPTTTASARFHASSTLTALFQSVIIFVITRPLNLSRTSSPSFRVSSSAMALP